jgi:hypothetical protein
MKNKLHEWSYAYSDKHSIQYCLIKIDHYDQRWRHGQFNSNFSFHLAAPYFSYLGTLEKGQSSSNIIRKYTSLPLQMYFNDLWEMFPFILRIKQNSFSDMQKKERTSMWPVTGREMSICFITGVSTRGSRECLCGSQNLNK